jgi:two-component system, NarL family, sensor histidine kinase DesK
VRRIHNPMSQWPWLRARPAGPERVLPATVWLAFVLFPLIDALTNHGSPTEHWLAVAAATAFVVGYICLLLLLWGPHRDPRKLGWLVFLAVIATALTLFDHRGWGFLFTYVAACVAVSVPTSIAFTAVVAVSVLAVVCSLLGGASAGTAISYGASTVGVGLLMVLLGDLRARNRELSEARAELARVAIMRERERFARDLHDLLGHSLSVIAIKAELAGRLLPDRTADAAAEVSDVEQVARQALREVRQAVSGYRQPTLEGELEGARMALSAAGIDAEFERAAVALDPEIEAVLAWAVREGATNVIRHSGARHCQVTIRAGVGDAAVEVLDDGAGCPGSSDEAAVNGHAGNGIAGLSERAERLRGRLEAGRRPDGEGFRLAVSVPIPAGGGT